MSIDPNLTAQVEAWASEDPDPETRAELAHLLEADEEEALRDRFAGPLRFGTAGLRGLLGGGPNRMNRAVVQRATAGLCTYVKKHVPGAGERGVCIGYDGRRMSREFAADVAEIVAGAGMKVFVFDHVVPTPLLAFAALDHGAAAAVMVTASHNPPAYNGYKVYWENGAQIIPPHDEGIAASIAAVGPLATIPRLERERAKAEGLLEELGPDLERRYLDGIGGLLLHREAGRDLSIAYTALHGVGQPYVLAALRDSGFEAVHTVEEQGEPDERFPTVEFPNPEEKGAMDRVLDLAREHQTDLVLANDPDADRLAVAARNADGSYVTLTGNDVGALLGHYVLAEAPADADRLVISTIVSSPMLGAIAARYGARWEQTLTGFKWIANRAIELERTAATRFVFGYEEALGYTVGNLVRDKDGIGAAAVVADLAAWCRARGRTILDELETCWRRYGMFLSRQISVIHEGSEGAQRIAAIVERARHRPPDRLADLSVLAVEDLVSGRRTPRGGAPAPIVLPRSDLVILELEGGHRAMVRPSGTEPKIKYYFDVRIELAPDESVPHARRRGDVLIDALAESLRSQVG